MAAAWRGPVEDLRCLYCIKGDDSRRESDGKNGRMAKAAVVSKTSATRRTAATRDQFGLMVALDEKMSARAERGERAKSVCCQLNGRRRCLMWHVRRERRRRTEKTKLAKLKVEKQKATGSLERRRRGGGEASERRRRGGGEGCIGCILGHGACKVNLSPCGEGDAGKRALRYRPPRHSWQVQMGVSKIRADLVSQPADGRKTQGGSTHAHHIHVPLKTWGKCALPS
ncbi:hypothetical protein IWZ03DRAFT_436747 [Phyllosticta citriasiana]|uniref:Uncharacterized protein n=1 Tax=Phyllosticta citriasiana TaxID=595635 RepID=A0ABR1K845_9PEZI